jgi:hypothetical protein
MNDFSTSDNGLCPNRSVADDGRIVCAKIVQGDNEVSPNLCRDCPARSVSCDNLRFSLQKSSPSPIVVRYNGGHTEVWDNDPPSISFYRAACAVKVMPVTSPKECAGCALRLAAQPEPVQRKRKVARRGKVVPFPQPAAAAGMK